MVLLRGGLAVLVVLVAGAGLAQESAAFAHHSAGQVDVLTKSSSGTSGSLELMFSGAGERYGATFGGSLLNDRLWFFGSASALPGVAERPLGESLDAKATAQLGDRSTLSAVFSQFETQAVAPLNSSFLSLRYDAVASSNVFFSGSLVLRRSR